ncbi:ABC transporter permease [Salinirubrum litoreum]|uniref:ABC transporter permease n=1 Tax=Salinirubrum litoreum TaxID=1126234 RepID=A0ABD5RFL4_9EURY|nr:ABC transporter permease [Salinirubrum litoreum]
MGDTTHSDVDSPRTDGGSAGTLSDSPLHPPPAHRERSVDATAQITSVPWLQQVRAFAVRTLRALVRNRPALIWGLAAPVFFFLVFGVLLGSGGVQRGANAVVFGVFGAFSVSLVVFATALSADLQARRYRKLRSLPVSPSADLFGRFLGGLALSTVSFCLVLGVGVLSGGTLAVRSALAVPVVLGSLVLFCLLAMGTAVVVASVLDDGEYVVGVTNMLTLALFFLTGYNGLLPAVAPGPLGSLVNALPNSLATRLAVVHLVPVAPSGTPLTPPALPSGWQPLALLVIYAVVGTVVGSWAMRRRIYENEGGE